MSLTAPKRWRALVGPAVILLAAAVATAPQLIRGNSCGHDFDFHLVSWFDCLSSWRHGIFYPHWSTSANYGAGEPRFVFYPPLTWMLGAALGALLPWPLVPIFLIFLLLFASGLATCALARQAIADAPATLAGCAALFSGYSLFTAYERSAFGELTGGFWIPLLLLFALRDRNRSELLTRRALDASTAPLALVVAGAWLSNAPLGVMASYLLAAVALAAALLDRSWAPILRASIAAALGMGLAAIYLIPAASEQRWIDIRQATDDPGLLIENSWLFARHAAPLLQLHDLELLRVSIIAAAMIAIALASLLVSWLRKTLLAQRRWWIPLALIPLAVLLLQFPVSLPLWNLLPKLRFLQFPWRWLVVLEAPVAIFFAAAVWPSNSQDSHTSLRRWWRFAVVVVCGAVFLAVSAVAGRFFFQACDEEDNVLAMADVYRADAGFAGTSEYAPSGADDSLLPSGLPIACLAGNPSIVLGVLAGKSAEDETLVWNAGQQSCEITFDAAMNLPEHLRIEALIPRPGYLILRLRSYPAWQVKVNGRPVSNLPRRKDGLMAVPVPRGPVDLSVDWTATADVILGRWLSAISVLLLAALCLLEWKFNLLCPWLAALR
jgi:hypothetical protein